MFPYEIDGHKTRLQALREYWDHIEKTNERFLAAPRPERRVMIAQDVISQLSAGLLRATHTYFQRAEKVEGAPPMMADSDLREALKSTPICGACAIGSVFIATVQRIDKITYGDLYGNSERDAIVRNDPQKAIHQYLSANELFTIGELRMMENLFEGNFGADYTTKYDVAWHHVNSEGRLRGIMEKLIEREGADLTDADFSKVPTHIMAGYTSRW